MKLRPPIITIIGHIDHGKTSIIDYLNKTNIIKNEKGNITQNILAYKININGESFVFIDTPGHNYFIEMREKSINITDIIILVISSNEGIKKQTIESINYIKNFNIPTIIVITKVDIGFNNINKIKNDLTKYNIIDKNIGGMYDFVYISIKNNYGIKDFLNLIIKYKNNIINKLTFNDKKLDAYIIELFNNKNGTVLYVITKNGYIKTGDILLFDNNYSKIKYIKNEYFIKTDKTFPSLPYYLYGFSNISNVYDNNLIYIKDIKEAKKKILNYNKNNSIYINDNKNNTLLNNDNLDFKKNNLIKLNYIIKCNNYGSYKAIKLFTDSLINNYKNIINTINISIGNINKNDIMLSLYSKFKILGFNINLNNKELNVIKKKNIFFKNYFIIYDLLDYINNEVNNILIQISKINYSKGLAEVVDVFLISKNNTILGCKILDGKIKVNSLVRIKRKNVILYDKIIINSIRIYKKNVIEVLKNTECGICIKKKININKKDIIESN
ncbi:translation initiation factor IF-2 [endosymbiont of Euscepes postfasciatus]|uniref:GTP-binding protein n=1 Tax=endosymbiont of Euscepes postfasciatus TaxID=650377 RepID=UPI000DC7362A|nr:GTP-binding protein [endosymbiont of Euscepes postfasciatus]BBA84573.1 translation initiation factor IF-2 [endosymbiont of Euscepes postfasciatus]